MPESKKQPVWHVAALGILTMLAYCFYWFYKNWRDLKDQAKAREPLAANDPLSVFKDINPILRTLGLFVPILNIYLYLTLVLGIGALNPDEQSLCRRRPLLTAGMIVGSMVGLLALSKLPDAFYLLFLTAVAPLAVVQHWLNKYWDTVEEPGLLTRHAFTWKELLSIIIGSMLLGLVVVRFMIGLPTPH